MEPYTFEASYNTPGVILDPNRGFILLEGRSIPENPGEFYEPIINWIINYFENPADLTKIEIKLEYINSGSSKFILEFFRVLNSFHVTGKNCQVTWYYEEEDEDIMDLGEHYRNTVHIPFEIKVLEEE